MPFSKLQRIISRLLEHDMKCLYREKATQRGSKLVESSAGAVSGLSEVARCTLAPSSSGRHSIETWRWISSGSVISDPSPKLATCSRIMRGLLVIAAYHVWTLLSAGRNANNLKLERFVRIHTLLVCWGRRVGSSSSNVVTYSL